MTALIQFLLGLVKLCATCKLDGISFKFTLSGWSELSSSLFSLLCGLFADFSVKVLKLYQVKRLAFFDSQKWRDSFATPCSLVSGYRPFALRSVFRTIFVENIVPHYGTAKSPVQELNSVDLAHRNAQNRAVGSPVQATSYAYGSFAVNDSSGVGEIRRCNWLAGRKLFPLFEVVSNAFPVGKTAGAFSSGRKINQGHQIYFPDRWSRLARCWLTASASLLHSNPGLLLAEVF